MTFLGSYSGEYWYSRQSRHSVQKNRTKVRQSRANRNMMATMPSVSQDSERSVLSRLCITMMRISITMKQMSSRDLRPRQNLVVLSYEKVARARWKPLVSTSRKAWAKGEQCSSTTTRACHHRSPNRNMLQKKCFSASISDSSIRGFHIWAGKNLQKISEYLLLYLTSCSSSLARSFGCCSNYLFRLLIAIPSTRSWAFSRFMCSHMWIKTGYNVAKMKAMIQAAALMPAKVDSLVLVLRSRNCRQHASTTVKYWQNMTEFKKKRGLCTKVTFMCLRNQLVLLLLLNTKQKTTYSTSNTAKATPTLQMCLKKVISLQQCWYCAGASQYKYWGSPASHWSGLMAMFWSCDSRKPHSAVLSRGLKDKDATQMCTQIFCRLCITCVQGVCSPRKKDAKPRQTTIRVRMLKKVCRPKIPSSLFRRAENLSTKTEDATLLIVLVFRQLSFAVWRSLPSKNSSWFAETTAPSAPLLGTCVATLKGYLHSTVTFLSITSYVVFSALSQYLIESLATMSYFSSRPFSLRRKMFWNYCGLLLTYTKLNASSTNSRSSQLYFVLNWKSYFQQLRQPIGCTRRLATPNRRVTLVLACTASNSMVRLELSSLITNYCRVISSFSWLFPHRVLPDDPICNLFTSRSLRQMSRKSPSQLSRRIRQKLTLLPVLPAGMGKVLLALLSITSKLMVLLAGEAGIVTLQPPVSATRPRMGVPQVGFNSQVVVVFDSQMQYPSEQLVHVVRLPVTLHA